MKRVVFTGIGVVSCLGNNQEEVYKSLLNAKSGITFSEEYKEYNLKSHVHGKPNINLEDHVDRKFIRFMGPGSAYNYISMNEAVKDSGLEEKDVSNISTGMIMGSGGPSIENVILAADKTREKVQKEWGLLLYQEQCLVLLLQLLLYLSKLKVLITQLVQRVQLVDIVLEMQWN